MHLCLFLDPILYSHFYRSVDQTSALLFRPQQHKRSLHQRMSVENALCSVASPFAAEINRIFVF